MAKPIQYCKVKKKKKNKAAYSGLTSDGGINYPAADGM